MAYSPAQRFALALAAPIVTAMRGDVGELAGRPAVKGRGRAELDDFLADREVLEHVASKERLVAWARERMAGDAKVLADVVLTIGIAVRAEVISEDAAWPLLLDAAASAQAQYTSWDELAAGYTRDGADELQAARAVWADIPWPTTNHVRVLAVTCATCGAPRTRASSTAYVYCDACGSLVDYDFAVAISLPIAQPGPVYERVRAQLALELSTAHGRGDRDAYRAIQRKLFDAWVDACPTACPRRVKDPAYRAAYVAWLAEAQVVADFDGEAQAREAAMHAAVGKLTFSMSDGKIRVPAEAFRALSDAMFDYEARRDELFVEAGVYALQPDGASRDIQRRIGLSMFVQAWLPMLDAAEAQALVERAGFVREYTLVPPAATHVASCARCGGALSLAAGAKRVVCDHCGRLVDVVGSM